MSTIIGIDLGTTHTVVSAIVDEEPRVLHRPGASALLPSVVAVDATGTLLVGESAEARLQHTPASGVRGFKRDMGSGRRWALGDHELGATELSALVLREARSLAEEVLGHSVARAVITVPAYFGESQRAATREAGELAGLEVVRIVNEPTAAAMAHGLTDSTTERIVAVLDLGGGTFDVTLLEIFDGIVEVRASGGDGRLGGEDMTEALVERFRPRVSAPVGALRAACEEAKRALSDADVAFLDVPADSRLVVTRAQLADACAPLLARMHTCILDTLRAGEVNVREVEEVVLAGGATRTTAVRALIESIFAAPSVGVDPDRVVSLGAAVQAGLVGHASAVSDMVVTDVLSHSVGIAIVREGEDRFLDGYFSPVLHRNTTLPVRRVERFWTVTPKQTVITVRVFEGEHRYIRENRFLGQFEVTGIPEAGDKDAREGVDIAFTHTLDGLLEVEATIVTTGKKASLLIEGHAGRLTDDDRERALAAIEALKVHPRDLLPNRLLLEHALARHLRLDPEARTLLDGPLTRFEDALERQQPEAIEAAAEDLRTALSHPLLQPRRPDATE